MILIATQAPQPNHDLKKHESFDSHSLFDGGGKRDRTDDLLHAMQALSQLSYTPVRVRQFV